ncbi:MAG: hypothetical protein P1V36_17080, partial [Planctomycetota bacterium]|nr:hypothetical protein [Planctomycetota bacterium]
DVLIKRRKAGQDPHWSIGWVAARVARNENEIVGAAYKHTVLDYYSAHAAEDQDAVKIRTWHRLIGFVDGLHNAGLQDASMVEGSPATPQADHYDDDKTLIMDA